jgi:hypothetical protein
MRWLRPSRGTAALGVATVLFCAMGGPAAAMTGGNFILGHSNTAANQTTLTSSGAGTPALSLTNTGTSAGSLPLKLSGSTALPPFSTNSSTKVAHLNADELDGLDSTAFQTKLLEGSNDDGPLPLTAVQTFTIPKDTILLVTFNATGFRSSADGPGMVGSALWLCKSAPCGPGTAVDGTVAQIFANQTDTHIGSSAAAEMELLKGTYTIGLSPDAQTQTDANDRFSWTIVEFPLS